MRDIRFRAWDVRLKKMYYGAETPFMYLTNAERKVSIGFELDPSMYHDTSRSFEKEIILMQFIGLKDKNGKEIYEGDIVKTCGDYADALGVVQYSSMAFAFVGKKLKPKEWEGEEWFDTITTPKYKIVNYVIVIGNIWENKDLLE